MRVAGQASPVTKESRLVFAAFAALIQKQFLQVGQRLGLGCALDGLLGNVLDLLVSGLQLLR